MSHEIMKELLQRLKGDNFGTKYGMCEKCFDMEAPPEPVYDYLGVNYCSHHYSALLKKESHEQWLKFRKHDLMVASKIPNRYVGQRFEAKTDEQKAVRLTVKAFIDKIEKKDSWCALILYGGVGTGKTLMASEMASAIIEKLDFSVRYCTVKQMISEIQAAYNTEGKSEEGEILRFVQYQVLILDEIDIKPDTKNAGILLQEVINRRYNEEKPVAIITNQNFDDLSQYVGDRIDSRLRENAFVCAFTWPDFRKQEAQ